jgi:hypothetical protein
MASGRRVAAIGSQKGGKMDNSAVFMATLLIALGLVRIAGWAWGRLARRSERFPDGLLAAGAR